jgi:hypothetical protein
MVTRKTTRQLLYWGCEVNLRESEDPRDRFFKFDLLKDHKHDYKRLKTAFPNEKFKQVVQKVLRNNYAAAKDSPESKQFNQLCDIFEFMCVEKHLPYFFLTYFTHLLLSTIM